MKLNARTTGIVAALAVTSALSIFALADMQDPMMGGHVLTLTNDTKANSLVVLQRGMDGSLKPVKGSPIPTGGKGMSGDIDDQGAVRIFGDYVYAVNPGSGTISVFKMGMDGLKSIPGSPVKSGGNTPISIAVSGNFVYVANQALTGTPNITGFKMTDRGLMPIKNSTIEFPKGLGPAQVEFSPNGGILVATSGFQTEGKGLVTSYKLQMDGTLKQSSQMSTGSASGDVGFSWDPRGRRVYVSNFRGSAIVVFDVMPDGSLSRKQTLGDNETAACWTAISNDGRTLYVANFVSNSISTYAISDTGELQLLGTVKRKGASDPDTKDLVLSPDGKFLYVLGSTARQISTFKIGMDNLPTELANSPMIVANSGSLKGLAIR